MALSKDWREFLELLNSRDVDYVIVGAKPRISWAATVHRGLGHSRATYPGQRTATS
jgi:hypothetical protein